MVTKAKLNKGEVCFRRLELNNEAGSPGHLLALKWFDKRMVYMISTKHVATEKWTGKFERTPNKDPVYKPSVIVDYTNEMFGVDLTDQLMNYYTFIRKSVKWWRKLWIHMLNMLVMNAFILNKKFGVMQMGHSEFREHLATKLIERATCTPPRAMTEDVNMDLDETTRRLTGRHFPKKMATENGKAKMLRCKVCSVGKKKAKDGHTVSRKKTAYQCQQCGVALCVDPCFKIYHTKTTF